MSSVGIFRVQQGERRQCQNLDVQDQRPVLDILQVAIDATLDFFPSVGFAAPAVDLGPACDAGLDLETGEVAVDHLIIKGVGGLASSAFGRGPTSESEPARTLNNCG